MIIDYPVATFQGKSGLKIIVGLVLSKAWSIALKLSLSFWAVNFV